MPDWSRHTRLWTKAIGSAYDWSQVTTPQAGLHGRQVLLNHGFGVGGSSSTNAMLYTRGDATDFNAWAHGGATGWSFADLEPYFLAQERLTEGNEPYLGRDGTLHLIHRKYRETHPASEDFLHAAEKRGHKRISDFCDPMGTVGAGNFITNIYDKKRFGAREAYLDPILDRANLTVQPDSRVIGLNFDGTDCTGVTLIRNGQVETPRAAQEVIIAANAIESPKLLLLSGIGPERHLRDLGIPIRVSLAGVGENFHDHIMSVLRFSLGREASRAEYDGDAALFFQSSSGWQGPDLEIIFNSSGFDRQPDDGAPIGLTMLSALLRPAARGTVRLKSSNPADTPLVDPRYLSVQSDIKRLATVVREAIDLSRTEPLNGWISGLNPITGLNPDADEAELYSWLRATAVSEMHTGGSCRIGLDEMSVVDPELRVHGTKNLRVVNEAVMPTVVSGHSHAAVLAIAGRASDLILGKFPLRPVAGHRS